MYFQGLMTGVLILLAVMYYPSPWFIALAIGAVIFDVILIFLAAGE